MYQVIVRHGYQRQSSSYCSCCTERQINYRLDLVGCLSMIEANYDRNCGSVKELLEESFLYVCHWPRHWHKYDF